MVIENDITDGSMVLRGYGLMFIGIAHLEIMGSRDKPVRQKRQRSVELVIGRVKCIRQTATAAAIPGETRTATRQSATDHQRVQIAAAVLIDTSIVWPVITVTVK